LKNREAEQRFEHTVQHWLADFGLAAEVLTPDGYCVITAADKTLVLDFLRIPYQKPNVLGFHFGIDYFLFHEAALKSRLASIFNKTKTIFARNCMAKRLNKETTAEFFNQNHLSGYANATFKFGLFYKEKLVAAITFAQGRNITRDGKELRSYELIGFCQAAGFTVTGGLSKLINAFVNERNPEHIATTVDVDWATGRGLCTIGFTKTTQLPPLAFALDWQTGARIFPSRLQRATATVVSADFPYHNSGLAKFEHIYSA
jgi:hypothetical protein